MTELVTRIASQLQQPGSALLRQVLAAVGREEVFRWPSEGGPGAPPAADVWLLRQEPGLRYRRVDGQMQLLAREELVQLLDAPAKHASRPWSATSLGRAVLAALDEPTRRDREHDREVGGGAVVE